MGLAEQKKFRTLSLIGFIFLWWAFLTLVLTNKYHIVEYKHYWIWFGILLGALIIDILTYITFVIGVAKAETKAETEGENND